MVIKVSLHLKHHLFCMGSRVKAVVIAFIHDLCEASSNPVHTNKHILLQLAANQ